MTDLTKTIDADTPPEIVALTTEQLREELAAALRLTADHLIRLGLIVRELERRGEDLSDLQNGLGGYLLDIAHGRLLPELVVRFAGRPAMLNRFRGYPLADQRVLSESQTIGVIDSDGRANLREIDNLKPSAVVFGRDHLRSVAEQQVALASRTIRERRPGVVHDPQRGGFWIRGAFIESAELIAAVEPGEPLSNDNRQAFQLHLTREQHAALKASAARLNISMADLHRAALRLLGYI